MTSDKRSPRFRALGHFIGVIFLNEVKIRWANQNDWYDLGLIHSESFRKAYKCIIPDDFLDKFTIEKRQNYYKKALSENMEKTAIMFVDNKAMGHITVGKCRDTDLDDSYGEIWGIYLLQDYWGKGFGKKLINWGVDRIKEFGFYKATLWVLKENTNAREFYEHLGFEFDGTEKLIKIGKELIEVRYYKSFV